MGELNVKEPYQASKRLFMDNMKKETDISMTSPKE
jgi:hypothetical protein